MPKYENSIIYKIKHNEDYDDKTIYIGSTSNFKNRKNQHKCDCNNKKNRNYNFPIYHYIRDNGNWEQWVMIPIEEYPCNSKNELVIKERHYIDLLRPVLNIVKPGRTLKEWREDNKQHLAEYYKNKYENDKEQFQEYQKKYGKDNKEKIQEKSKKYYENNKEQIAEYKKKWCEANKEILHEKRKEKVICDHCGFESIKNNLTRHQKSKKCINFVKTE
jgi:hypothetical protein